MPTARLIAAALFYTPIIVGVFAGCGEANLQSSSSSPAAESKESQAAQNQKSNTSASLQSSEESAPKVGLRHSTEDEGILCSADAASGGSAEASEQANSACLQKSKSTVAK
jgi:hypothetical protein